MGKPNLWTRELRSFKTWTGANTGPENTEALPVPPHPTPPPPDTNTLSSGEKLQQKQGLWEGHEGGPPKITNSSDNPMAMGSYLGRQPMWGGLREILEHNSIKTSRAPPHSGGGPHLHLRYVFSRRHHSLLIISTNTHLTKNCWLSVKIIFLIKL